MKHSGKPPVKTLSTQVYETLRDRIVNGDFAPGTSLVRRKISRDLGVSPIPVTEALWRLERDGLVDYEPMQGSRVRTLSIESVKDELILREAVECQSARLCAELATDEQFHWLRERAAAVDGFEHRGDLRSPAGVALHMAFHLDIARLSGSQLLENELQRVGYSELMRMKWTNAGAVPAPLDWHGQLVDGLATRDPLRADEAMREHVRYGLGSFWNAVQVLASLAPSRPAFQPTAVTQPQRFGLP